MCLGYSESPLVFGPGASTVPLSAASFLMVMLKGNPGGNISIAPSPFGWAGHSQPLSICWHCWSPQDVWGCMGMYGGREEACSRGVAWLRVERRKGCHQEEREDKSRRKKQKNKERKYSSVPKHLLALSHFLFHIMIAFPGVLKTTCVPCVYVQRGGCRDALRWGSQSLPYGY